MWRSVSAGSVQPFYFPLSGSGLITAVTLALLNLTIKVTGTEAEKAARHNFNCGLSVADARVCQFDRNFAHTFN